MKKDKLNRRIILILQLFIDCWSKRKVFQVILSSRGILVEILDISRFWSHKSQELYSSIFYYPQGQNINQLIYSIFGNKNLRLGYYQCSYPEKQEKILSWEKFTLIYREYHRKKLRLVMYFVQCCNIKLVIQ